MADQWCWWCERGERYELDSYDAAALQDVAHPDSNLTPTQHATANANRYITLCKDCAHELVDDVDSDDADGDGHALADQCYACSSNTRRGVHSNNGMLCHLDGQTYCTVCVLGWLASSELEEATDMYNKYEAKLAVVRGEQCVSCGYHEYPGTFSDCQGNPYCEECIRPVIRRMHG